ncbi:MAG: B12-binding domain-containing radical SAM protein [Deltaproteobacteria bacterium]|nr:B12-binding domain-containing radical SAM protein [Deltaproteobacteria bacterium]
MRGSVALIYPYFLTAAKVHLLFQPLGIATLASQLQEVGVRAVQYDCTFRRLDAVVDAVLRQRPAIVGIYAMATMSKNALRLLEALRPRLEDALFVAGGPLPTVYPERFARRFDVVFRGEADRVFAAFCTAYLGGAGPQGLGAVLEGARYPGIYADLDGRVVAAPPVHHSEEVIDALPLPDRRGVDLRPYHEVWERERGYRAATIMLTRGCPYQCDFCSKPVFGERFRRRKLTRVMEEIDEIRALGYDQLWIGDDSFTLDNRYLEAFCDAMQARGQGMTWTCLSRVTGIDVELPRRMREAGCTRVYLGLESASDQTLKLMKKKATVADAEAAITRFSRAGVKTAGFFMVGYPGETAADVERTFAWALRLPLDEISFTVPYPLPGSALFDRVAGVDQENDWEIENEVKLLFSSEFDAGYLRRRIDETMSAFAARR